MSALDEKDSFDERLRSFQRERSRPFVKFNVPRGTFLEEWSELDRRQTAPKYAVEDEEEIEDIIMGA